jgi:hypothetical protein
MKKRHEKPSSTWIRSKSKIEALKKKTPKRAARGCGGAHTARKGKASASCHAHPPRTLPSSGACCGSPLPRPPANKHHRQRSIPAWCFCRCANAHSMHAHCALQCALQRALRCCSLCCLLLTAFASARPDLPVPVLAPSPMRSRIIRRVPALIRAPVLGLDREHCNRTALALHHSRLCGDSWLSWPGSGSRPIST